LGARLFQIRHMAGVQDVEAAVGEHDAFFVRTGVVDCQQQLLEVSTPRSEPSSRWIARRSSGALMAAVPSLPTTMPPPGWPGHGVGSSSPAAMAAARVEITVSPAPVTSNTSRAGPAGASPDARTQQGHAVLATGHQQGAQVEVGISAAPLLTSSCSSAQPPTMASNSLRFGVIRLAPR
jgi:hypothetical protein